MWKILDSSVRAGEGFLVDLAQSESYPLIGAGILPMSALYILVDQLNIRDYGEVAPLTQEKP